MPSAPAKSTMLLAHDLRETLGMLVRRVRAEPGPPAHVMAVLALLDRQGPAGVSDLAAVQKMRPQSMAQTVREMESSGLVSRRPDPDDGRRAFVELTAEGRRMLKATRAAREDWLAQALDRELDAGEREAVREALALLARVAES
ncbi:putative HTH-type transcriptional regulator [Baekduia alba]|uniref:MarR family winged helix-turn-helix transcriptional regulator n=1 Tax=Baekduia alba TaxID=2997333 RepID=UPI0023409D38|nr:MarR family transcriptional regulator [Baekduia alba]WCB95438.1 putative HTH-type transcriptional regulator [Baekduia alba]